MTKREAQPHASTVSFLDQVRAGPQAQFGSCGVHVAAAVISVGGPGRILHRAVPSLQGVPEPLGEPQSRTTVGTAWSGLQSLEHRTTPSKRSMSSRSNKPACSRRCESYDLRGEVSCSVQSQLQVSPNSRSCVAFVNLFRKRAERVAAVLDTKHSVSAIAAKTLLRVA